MRGEGYRPLSPLEYLVEGGEELDTPHKVEDQLWDPLEVDSVSLQWLDIIKKVTSTGQYNYLGAKIRVNFQWNADLLEGLLVDYYDKQIIQFLKYGFPVDRDPNIPLKLGGINHKGATMYPEQIDKYLEKEKSLGGTIGPFEAIPFVGPVAVSPLSTRPKKDADTRRVIMDCSWPIGSSLNDGLSKDNYLGEEIDF